MAAYAATITRENRVISRIAPGVGVLFGSVNLSNYNTTGAEITDITGYFKTKPFIAPGMSSNGYMIQWDRTNGWFNAYYPTAAYAPTFTGTANVGTSGVVTDNDAAATLGHALYVMPMVPGHVVPEALEAEASATGLIKDSDTAAADGVAVYVVVDDVSFHPTYQLGHFEFVSPTNANGTCTIANGAETLTLYDNDDAASAGVVTRIVAASGGWEATTAASKDILVPVSSGKFIHVNHATTGSTPQVYFDEDAANTYDRLQAVVVDNTDEPYLLFVGKMDSEVPTLAAPGGGFLGQIVTVGPKPFSFTVGSSGPSIFVASRPDAASLQHAVLLYARAAGAGLNAANSTGQDLLIPTSTGELLRVTHIASPTGVQVYGYPEGATADVRLLGVIVDNTDEAIATEAAVGWKRDTPAGTITQVSAAAGSEVANDVDVGTFDFIAYGIIN